MCVWGERGDECVGGCAGVSVRNLIGCHYVPLSPTAWKACRCVGMSSVLCCTFVSRSLPPPPGRTVNNCYSRLYKSAWTMEWPWSRPSTFRKRLTFHHQGRSRGMAEVGV